MKTTAPKFRRRPLRAARAQRGVVMFVAMVVLIVMTLAGLAMLRQIGSSTAIAGNLAFKRGATASADLGIEAARKWLADNAGTTLNGDVAASSYFATWGATTGTGLQVNEVDPTRGNWVTTWNNVAETVDPATQDRVRFVIQRLCKLPGAADAAGQDCAATPGVDPNKGGPSGITNPKPPPNPYYRVTAQVRGARNTVSYTQVVLGSGS